eukprot:TRINITY_DN11917_c0_g1_i3.p1 TRINITY_DN11917_c0_g1~~TRINITY_DN11917_c0_g1_i3.p1  ORF type:complete len:419 (+),score=54.33 TRINITY_DN11917_c0_g1_i3:344-1600(+)
MEMDCFSDIAFDGFAPAKEGLGNMFADIRVREGDSMSLGIYTDAQKISPEVKFTKSNINGMGYSTYLEVQPNKGIGVVVPYDNKEEGLGGVSKYLRRYFPRVDDALQYGVGYALSSVSLFKFGVKSNAPYYGDWMEYNVSKQKDTHTRNKFTDEWVLDGGLRFGFGRTIRQTISLFSRSRDLKHPSKPFLSSSISGFSYDATYDARESYPRPYSGMYPQPTSGHAFWASVECTGKYSGMPSSDQATVSHVKAEIRAQKLFQVFPPFLHLALSGKIGNVLGSQFDIKRNDRFYGETEYVRGFTKIGKQDSEGLTGGDVIAAGSATLSFPIPTDPIIPSGIVGGHLFLDAAGIGLKKDSNDGFLSAVKSNAAASVGAGFHIAGLPLLGTMGKLEVNFSYPLTGATKDTFSRRRVGLQWAI